MMKQFSEQFFLGGGGETAHEQWEEKGSDNTLNIEGGGVDDHPTTPHLPRNKK
jgi:hypothetical protein